MTNISNEEYQKRLKEQNQKAQVLRTVILELHQNQVAIKAGMKDRQFVAKVISRIYHDRLVGINKTIYDESLELSERVKPYFSDEHDATYGRAMAYRFGLTLDMQNAVGYDVLKYTGDLRIELTGDGLVNYVHYLRGLGAVPTVPKILPATDGINHINIYSKGVSSVGRALSNFHTPSEPYVTLHGSFASLEGYYHWLRVADYHCEYRGESLETMELKYPELKELRTANGDDCIRLGRKCKAAAYAKTSYRPGKFTGKFFHAYVDALIRKLASPYREHDYLGSYTANLILGGYKLVHYYKTGDGMKWPPHGEWLPELITTLCEHIDPSGDNCFVDDLTSRIPEILGE